MKSDIFLILKVATAPSKWTLTIFINDKQIVTNIDSFFFFDFYLCSYSRAQSYCFLQFDYSKAISNEECKDPEKKIASVLVL